MILYKDINSEDVETIATNETAIRESIRNIILIHKHSMPGVREFGSRLNELLFEEPDKQIKDLIKLEIMTLINNFEPRVNVVYVEVDFDDGHNLTATVAYKFKESFLGGREDTVKMLLK